VVGTSDGRINIFDVKLSRSLVTLVALDENDWVVYTKDDYNASDGGIHLVALKSKDEIQLCVKTQCNSDNIRNVLVEAISNVH
jgi:hypothetical protein